MIIDQTQIQYDIYYQGTPSQLFALMYPLGGPNSPVFQHLSEQKVTYEPQSKLLTYVYEPDNFENIDKQKETVTYTSKLSKNLSNYFYSTFNPQTECFVWRNLNRFLEMRPKNRVSPVEGGKQEEKKKPTNDQKSGKKQGNSQQIQQQPTIVQLQVIQSGQPGNIVEKQISDAPITELKPLWHCSKDEYFSYLSN